MAITFAQMGFAPEVTASSETPDADGYVGTYQGLPYHVHPEATPDAFTALCAAIAADQVTVSAYIAPVVSLAVAQQRQTDMLRFGCSNAITGGFSSSALGSTHAYPSTVTDQANQTTVAGTSSGGLLWCETGDAWAFAQHSQVQAQQAVADFAKWLNACQSKLVALVASVGAATEVTDVQAIVWTPPSNQPENN